jgi:Ankyrin repeat
MTYVCHPEAARFLVHTSRLLASLSLVSLFGSSPCPQAGNTPLHNCAYEGWTDGIKALLSAGARVNATNNVRPG